MTTRTKAGHLCGECVHFAQSASWRRKGTGFCSADVDPTHTAMATVFVMHADDNDATDAECLSWRKARVGVKPRRKAC